MQFYYSNLSKGRKEAVERFGTIFQIPVIRSSYGYLRNNYNNETILDVGAGVDLYIKRMLNLDRNTYFSLDNDLSGTFTFRDIADIPPDKEFYWIVLNQLLEHLSIEETYSLLTSLRPHLHRNGKMVITVPNIFHPIRYWGDPTHVTHWGYAPLYAMCRITEYKVTNIFRYYKRRRLIDPLSWIVERIMRHIYRIDWCESIMIIATK